MNNRHALTRLASAMFFVGLNSGAAVAHSAYSPRSYSRINKSEGDFDLHKSKGTEAHFLKRVDTPVKKSSDASFRASDLISQRNRANDVYMATAKQQLAKPELISDSSAHLSIKKSHQVRGLVIVDGAVDDKHILFKHIKPGFDVVEINAQEDGLLQLKEVLAGYQALESLHIVSHAQDGVLTLGTRHITEQVLRKEIDLLSAIDNALVDGADLLLYGCDLAKSAKGEKLLDLIASSANVDIAASNNVTGNAKLGGDWQLEIVKGDITSEQPFSDIAVRDFSHTLAPEVYTSGSFCVAGCGTPSTSLTSSDGHFVFTGNADGSGENVHAYNTFRPDDGMYFDYQTSLDGDSTGLFNFAADGVTVGSFELTGLVYSTYSGSCSGGSVVGYVAGGGTVSNSLTWSGTNTSATLSNFSGVQITHFRVNGSGCSTSVYQGMGVRSFTVDNKQASADSDGSLTAAGTVSEPVAINTTVDSAGEAVDVFDFTLSDGGSSDGLAMGVSQIVLNVTGTASDAQRSNITWRLNGPDATNLDGVYNGGSDTITFSGLSISIANGGSEDYTINAYYTDNTGLTEGLTYILSVDGDTDLTVSGTQMGATSAVTNGSGSAVDVTATTLAFATQPASSVSGSALGTQPTVAARDAFGNTDIDFTETITLSEASAGSLTNAAAAASSGVATFVSLTYTATADQQSFTLTANDQDGLGADFPTVDANSVTADVVATTLVFDTQPAPLSVNSGVATSFTTVPVVSARDGNNVVDTGYSTGISLAEVNGAGSATMSATGDADGSGATVTIVPSSGVSTFTSMQITYIASGGASENFNLQANSGGLSAANSAQLTALVDATPPAISDANISISGASGIGGAYIVGDTITATWNNTAGGDNNNDVSTVTVDFSQFGGGASVSASNSSDTWTATHAITEDGGGSIDASSRNVSVTATDTSANADTVADTTSVAVDNDSPIVTDGNISISGASGTGGAYIVGDTVTATWNNTAGGDNNSDTISGVTVDFSPFGGGAAVVASNSSGTWTATYTIVAGAIDATNLNVSTTATDNAGNTTTAADTSNAAADNAVPTITNVTIPNAAAIVGDAIAVTITASEAGLSLNSGTVNGVAVTGFTDNGGGSYSATYTVAEGHTDRAAGDDIPVSFVLGDGAGNSSATYTTAISQGGDVIDANTPSVTNVTIPNASAAVGDAIAVAISASEAGLSLNSGTVNGVAVTGFTDSGGGSYSATYTVAEGHTDRAAGDDVPVSFVLDDGAGNSSATYATAISQGGDAIDANSPSVTNVTIPNTSAAVGDAIAVTITASEAGLSLNSGTVNGVAVTGFTDSGGGSYSATYTVAEGHTDRAAGDDIPVSFVLDDGAGNSSAAFTTSIAQGGDAIDANSPVVSETAAVSTPTNDAAPDVTIASTQAGTLSVGGSCGSGDEGAIASGNNTLSLTQPDNTTPLADGTYSDCTVSVVDDAGNASNVLTLTSFTIDATAPAAASTPDMDAASDSGSSDSDNITSDTTPTFSGTAEANSTVTLNSSADGDVGIIAADGAGNWSITASTLSAGTHNIAASATDAVGNSGPASSALAIVIDVTAPPASSAPDMTAASDTGVSNTDNNTADTTPTFVGATEANASVTLNSSVDGQVGSTTADGAGNWSITASTLTSGSHNITATTADVAGNTGVASSALAIIISSPTIASVSIPNSAMIVGDVVPVSIVATGSGFTLISGAINGVSVTGFSDGGGGNYTAVYSVAEGNTDRAPGDSIPVSFLLQDGAGNNTNTFTTAIVQNADPIDANSPGTASGALAVNENATDTTSVGTVSATDTASYTLVDDAGGRFAINASSGAVTVADGSLLNFEDDSSHTITVRAEDASTNTTDTVLSVTINNVNDLPVASDDSASTNEDNAVMIDVLTNDSDEDGTLNAASVTVVGSPSNGSTSVNTGTGVITYSPNADYEGSDSFTYTVLDNETGLSNAAAVTLTINAQNDAPMAADDLATTAEDTPVIIDAAANDSDIDSGDSLDSATLTVVSMPSDGNVSISAGQFTYTPDLDFFGTDSFTYTIDDQSGATSNTASVTINVSGINDSPTAANDSATTDEDTEIAIDVLANDSDIDGALDAATLVVVALPLQGTVGLVSGQLVYTPDANTNGIDSFTYTVQDDENATSNAATVDVVINAVNDSPTANDDTASLLEDGTLMINVLGNDSDVETGFDPASVTLAIAHSPANGSVNIESNGLITYTPDAFYNGDDSFRYTVTDADGGVSNEALVSITVASVNNAPLVNNDSFATSEDVSAALTPLANDSDIDGTLELSQLVIVAAPTLGSLEDNGDGTLTYTPQADVSGVDSFTYTIADNEGLVSAPATVTVTITSVDDAPIISGVPANSALVGQNYSFTPIVSDVDSTSFTFSVANLPSWLLLNTVNGTVSGSPGVGDIGSYTDILLTVSDASTSASLALFSIDVEPDTDSDGIADAIDEDDDGDGLPDTFEIANGLDPLDPGDAEQDADGDGLNNVSEFEQGFDLFSDDQPPLFGEVAAVNIDATGLLTALPDNSAPSAVDALDGTVPVSLQEQRSAFLPGRHLIVWRASDAAGNTSEATQVLNISPQVSLEQDKLAARGNPTSLRIVLNGEAPEYPVLIDYSVAGTAQLGIDHNLASGTAVIESGLEVSVPFNVLVDESAGGGDAMLVSLDPDSVNLGEQPTQSITLVDGNLPPKLRFEVRQNGFATTSVWQDSGEVSISVVIDDPNPGDTHQVQWSASPQLNLLTVDDVSRSFDPVAMDTGIYAVLVRVTDSGSSATSISATALLKLSAAAPILTDMDSDGDGVNDIDEGPGDSDKDKVQNFADAIPNPSVLQESVNARDTFLIQTEPGIQLSLGQAAFATEDFGAMLSDDEIASLLSQGIIDADSIENVGGYFDFVATGLNIPGASVNFVVPQLQVIPTNAVYRKYASNSGWSDFVENANNTLASAPGSEGSCPAASSGAYQAGLNEGHWCVLLTIEDGGPNDADGEANGAIADPGGVGRLVGASIRSSGGGGFGWPMMFLAVFGGLLALRRRYLKQLLPLVLLALMVSTAPENAQAIDWDMVKEKSFVEFSAGSVEGSESARKFRARMMTDGFDVDLAKYDQSRSAFHLSYGYEFNENHSLMLGYSDLGEVEVDLDAEVVRDLAALSAALEEHYPRTGDGWSVAYRYRHPMTENAGVFAGVGVLWWDGDIDLKGVNTSLGIDGGVDPSFTVGADYLLVDVISLGLNYWVQKLDDQQVDGLGVLLRYEF